MRPCDVETPIEACGGGPCAEEYLERGRRKGGEGGGDGSRRRPSRRRPPHLRRSSSTAAGAPLAGDGRCRSLRCPAASPHDTKRLCGRKDQIPARAGLPRRLSTSPVGASVEQLLGQLRLQFAECLRRSYSYPGRNGELVRHHGHRRFGIRGTAQRESRRYSEALPEDRGVRAPRQGRRRRPSPAPNSSGRRGASALGFPDAGRHQVRQRTRRGEGSSPSPCRRRPAEPWPHCTDSPSRDEDFPRPDPHPFPPVDRPAVAAAGDVRPRHRRVRSGMGDCCSATPRCWRGLERLRATEAEVARVPVPR